jgi:AraC-like DNA-binding protein
MHDVLLSLASAALRESAREVSYFWDNRRRTGGGAIFQFTWSGEGALRSGGGVIRCGPGQALLMIEGDETQYYFPAGATAPWTFLWLNFLGAAPLVARTISDHGGVLTLDPRGEAVESAKSLARLYESSGFRDRFEVSERLGHFLSALGRELTSPGSSHAALVPAAQSYLRDHHRRPINIKEAAVKFGMSREHFSRAYRRETGSSPARHLREFRLETARHLLETTRMSANEVAERSGFGSVSHFCRAFKAAFSTSPLEFRKRSGA